MINESKTQSREGLVMRVHALRLVEKAFRKNPTGVIPAIRRISRSLTLTEGIQDHPEVLALVRTLHQTPDKDMKRALTHVFPRLNAMAAGLQTRKHTILIIEDNATMGFFLKRQLSTLHQQVIVATTLAEAEKNLLENQVSLILLDLQLPDGDGRELLVKLRERPATSAIPLFITSSKKESRVQTECFALGADAYFQKPYDPLTLSAAIAARLQKIADAQRLSAVDPLTGLPNRSGFADAFARASMLAARGNETLSTALLDLDRFKAINDLHGHATGDLVLQRLVAVLAKSLRGTDFVARWGGEEFAVFFPSTDLDEAGGALNKALKAFRAERFMGPEGSFFHITFSAGVARAAPGMSASKAIAEADRILYLAKAAGRDRVLTQNDKVSLKKTILLVEDSRVAAVVTKRHLERNGFRVLHANNGRAALRTSDASIAIILIDDNVPGLNGFELLQRYRSIPALHHVPIMMLTSAGKQENILRGFELGADDYMVKPFSPLELLARIHRFIEKH